MAGHRVVAPASSDKAGSIPRDFEIPHPYQMAHTPETRARAYEKMKQRKADWFAANGPCSCGSWERLELDHIDPSTKIHHAVWSWSEERREAELAKCQVLCHDCHLQKTIKDFNWRQHGTPSMYSNGKCRCDECRETRKLQAQYHRSKGTW